MPGALGPCYLIPGLDSWQRDVEDRQGAYFIGILRGIGIGHHSAHIMADEVHACPSPSFATSARMSPATITLD
jgi:hypothetical protein